MSLNKYLAPISDPLGGFGVLVALPFICMWGATCRAINKYRRRNCLKKQRKEPDNGVEELTGRKG